jgi:hypothetical protein
MKTFHLLKSFALLTKSIVQFQRVARGAGEGMRETAAFCVRIVPGMFLRGNTRQAGMFLQGTSLPNSGDV